MKRIPIEPATRAYAMPISDDESPRTGKRKRASREKEPAFVLVFDTETTIDTAQSLTFGVYRVYHHGSLVDEGLFHADNLPEADMDILRQYARDNASDVLTSYGTGFEPLSLYSRHEWEAKVWHRIGYKAKALIVGFNLPFDLSRIAVSAHEGKRHNKGAYILSTKEYQKTGKILRPDIYHPNITIRSIDSKRALIQFGIPKEPERERGRTGKGYRGRFLDLRTLAFALTNVPHSLASACNAFGAEHGKHVASEHGIITAEYIGYARQDVRATYSLYKAMTREYDRHTLDLPPWRVMSPASIGKAYLRKMGIAAPGLAVADDVGLSEDAVHAACMQAYYGGRAECRIRHTKVPVVYLDFTSMYPTVNALMGQWRLLTAHAIGVEDATAEVTAFLASVCIDTMLQPESWRILSALVQVAPDDDIFPVRYRTSEANTFSIGVNYFTADYPIWYTLADVTASVLLTSKVPRIVRAVRFVPSGQQPTRTVKLRGDVPVNPRDDDFFRLVIEERQRIKQTMKITSPEKRAQLDATQTFLKVVANSTSYGIYVEMNRQENEPTDCLVWHGSDSQWSQQVENPEELGEYFCSPLAASITGAARLMLALAECLVRDAGGHYAMMDTDSVAIVASESGGNVKCSGTVDGKIRALSWSDVEAIRERFATLNPYDSVAAPGSLLKIEDANYGPDHKQRPIWCYAISAKRYALFRYRQDKSISIVKASEHGLGHAFAPYQREEPDSEHRLSVHKVWMADVWETNITTPFNRAIPIEAWHYQPVLTLITLSKPETGRAFADVNAKKSYAKRIKPFNFLMTAHPDRLCAGNVKPIAPYGTDVARWRSWHWLNARDGSKIAISTDNSDAIGVQTFRTMLDSFRMHAESKSGSEDGTPCRKDTRGLLHRTYLNAVREPIAIGKEANKLEDVQGRMIQGEEEVFTFYVRDGDGTISILRDLWYALPVESLAQDIGLASDKLRAIATGTAQPHESTRNRIRICLVKWLREQCRVLGESLDANRVLTLEGLSIRYRQGLRETREDCQSRLGSLIAHIGMREAGRLLGVSVFTVQHWHASGIPHKVTIVAHVDDGIAPYRDALTNLDRLREDDPACYNLARRSFRQSLTCAPRAVGVG